MNKEAFLWLSDLSKVTGHNPDTKTSCISEHKHRPAEAEKMNTHTLDA